MAAGTLHVYSQDEIVKVGETIEFWGTGFDTVTYYFYFSSERAAVGDKIDSDVLNYEKIGSKTSTDGTFVFSDFTIPDILIDGDNDVRVYGGTYYLYAVYYNKDIAARITLEVESSAVVTSISPNEGTAGTEVVLAGEGFGNREDISVKFDSISVAITSGSDETNNSGKFSDTTITVPAGATGTHTITVTGVSTGLEATINFTSRPKISVSPASGPAGTSITVSGTGYSKNKEIAVSFNNVGISTATSDSNGSFSAVFAAPSLASNNSYTISASDGTNSATSTFAISQTIFSITPTSGSGGTVISIGGSGFKASSALAVTFNNTPIAGTYSTDASGTIPTITYTAPSLAVGSYIVRATDGTNSGEMTFTITTSATISQVTSPSAPGKVGSQLTVSGSGYTVGGTVTINFNSTPIGTATVGSGGTFSASVIIPAAAAGEHVITASDGIHSQVFNFYMESAPPPTPQPLLPEMNTKAHAQTTFDWQDVTDDSLPVTYTLQIATSNTFAADSIVLDKSGIAESAYILTKEERLNTVTEEAPYYWRLRAVDAAGNVSPWTGAGIFTVGMSFGLSQAWIYVIISICALLLAGFAFWMGRKTAYY